MADPVSGNLFGCGNGELSVCGGDHAGVTDLAAHGGVEGSLCADYAALLSLGNGIAYLGLLIIGNGDGADLILNGELVIAHELGGNALVIVIPHGSVRAHVVGGLSCSPCLFLLFLHAGLKAFLVNGEALLLQDLCGEVDGKSVGVVELEGIGAGKHGLAFLLKALLVTRQDGKSGIYGPVELLLLLGEVVYDEISLFVKLGISVL